MHFSQPSTQRRRSERVSQPLPLTVLGHDSQGRPFEEPATTVSFNLHGCRYASKHHVAKNSWVTLQVTRGQDCLDRRARVAWIQRPHSVREFFEVALEFEEPANLWDFEPAPQDWAGVECARKPGIEAVRADAAWPLARFAKSEISEVPHQNTSSNLKEKSMNDMSNASPIPEPTLSESPVFAVADSLAAEPNAESSANEPANSGNSDRNPLLRELSAELERRARHALDDAIRAAEQAQRAAEDAQQKQLWASEESFRKWKEEFEQTQNAAREEFAARQNDLLGRIRSEFDEGLGQAKHLIEEIEKNREAMRAENEAAAEATGRVARARLEFEALEAARAAQAPAVQPMQEISEEVVVQWKERLEGEMTAAQSQWNELLESSLDSGIQRLAQQLSATSADFLRDAEPAVSSRFNEISRPLLESLAQAREKASEVKLALDDELTRAKASLAEIEQGAARMNDFSTRVDAAASHALEELNRWLQTILDTQTRALDEHAEALTAAIVENAASSLEVWRQKMAESTAAEVEAKLAPQLERVPQILHELSSREVQTAESLRLHRERLRQLSEKNEKELIGYLSAAVEVARDDFEAARKEAVAKWSEELEVCGARAAHATADAIDKAAHWSEQDARARLQTLLEQTLSAAGTSLDAKVGEAQQRLTDKTEAESAAHAATIREQLDSFAADLTGTARTQIERAAEAAAAGFGEVLQRTSDQQFDHLTRASREAVQSRTQELEASAAQLLRNFGASVESLVADVNGRMASQFESSVAEGRSALTSECHNLLAAFHSDQQAHQKDWAETLERLSSEAAERYQERLQTTTDSWLLSSVRRLSEHGQNAIESLTRSSDRALRDSCARLFEGLAELFRGDNAGAETPDGSPSVAHEAAQAAPAQEAATQG